MSNEDIDAAIQLGIEQERNRILDYLYWAIGAAYGCIEEESAYRGAINFVESNKQFDAKKGFGQ